MNLWNVRSWLRIHIWSVSLLRMLCLAYVESDAGMKNKTRTAVYSGRKNVSYLTGELSEDYRLIECYVISFYLVQPYPLCSIRVSWSWRKISMVSYFMSTSVTLELICLLFLSSRFCRRSAIRYSEAGSWNCFSNAAVYSGRHQSRTCKITRTLNSCSIWYLVFFSNLLARLMSYGRNIVGRISVVLDLKNSKAGVNYIW